MRFILSNDETRPTREKGNVMEPSIETTHQARAVLAEVKQVADPIQRGDLPYSFSVHQLIEAHGQAASVVTFATRLLARVENPIDHRDAEVLTLGTSYLNTLTAALLGSDNVPAELQQLLQYFVIAPSFISEQIIRPTVDV